MAEMVGQFFVDEDLGDCVEYNEKTRNFKLRVASVNIPDSVLKAMKVCTKESATNFSGMKMKVRILPSNLLSKKLLSELKSLGQTFSFTDWVSTMLEDKKMRREQAGLELFPRSTR